MLKTRASHKKSDRSDILRIETPFRHGPPVRHSTIPRSQSVVAALAVTAIFLLHNDFWNREPRLEPWLGWLPADIGYHLVWIALAAGATWLVARAAWRRTR